MHKERNSCKKEGNLFVIAAPSGAGKTSLVRALVKQVDHILISVSYTTRPPRPRDQEGIDYFFVSEARFQQMIKEHAFLEYAEVYRFHYGTGKEWVMHQLAAGDDVILEIDWQGARQIRYLFPSAISIFILPPSAETLKKRLLARRQDNLNTINERMAMAKQEMEHCHEFNYWVVNDDFDQAVQDLLAIVRAERLKLIAQKHTLTPLLADLMKTQ
ncbi:MAG: guanylate kinase [Coxiella sp. RIFCSPHIGHO2_12_FULL_44_14]|nr:MAG: guanylate kinase [Coxiella sp. RIFCSPHIGHO2_12_FULL_44_14]